VPVVGRQRKNLNFLLDECASSWRTTQKLAIKRKLVMLRHYNFLFLQGDVNYPMSGYAVGGQDNDL